MAGKLIKSPEDAMAQMKPIRLNRRQYLELIEAGLAVKFEEASADLMPKVLAFSTKFQFEEVFAWLCKVELPTTPADLLTLKQLLSDLER